MVISSGAVSNYPLPGKLWTAAQICIYKTERLAAIEVLSKNYVAPLKVKKFLIPPVDSFVPAQLWLKSY
jgi:hypothetical protein